MIFLQLFWSFFQIGMFSIGGGMAAMPLIQNQVVDLHHWLTLTEFTDLITIAEMTPGPIAINAATFVGIRLQGFWVLVATFGCIFPSCVIVSLLAWVYFKFKELTVIQGTLRSKACCSCFNSICRNIYFYTIYMGRGGFSINPESINYISLALFSVAVFILRKYKPSPVL